MDGLGAVLVVKAELDLAVVGPLARSGAGVDHVVGLLGAQLTRREAADGPNDGVGDVGLAGPVRADDNRDAGLEGDLDWVGERLEAPHMNRAEVHASTSLTRAPAGAPQPACSRSSARRAAACSASFFEAPAPRPYSSSSTSAAHVKARSCGGPSTETTA